MLTIVSIPGIHCASCKALIEDVSLEFPAISSVNVDLTSKEVRIDHEEGFDLDAWTREVESLNDAYKVQKL